MTDNKLIIKCLIVDDEPNAIRILEEYIRSFSQLAVVATARNAFDALVILQNNAIDLLFLDIQMPAVTGMQLLKTLKDTPAVIITTAHRDFAAEAFDFQVLDYLLKPISFERFSKSVDRYLASVKDQNTATAADDPDGSFLVIRSNRKELRIPFREILYLQATGDYVTLHLKNGEKPMTLETLSGISERLPEKEFARIHRSYLVNKRHIRAIGNKTVGIGNTSLPISRNYRPLI